MFYVQSLFQNFSKVITLYYFYHHIHNYMTRSGKDKPFQKLIKIQFSRLCEMCNTLQGELNFSEKSANRIIKIRKH